MTAVVQRLQGDLMPIAPFSLRPVLTERIWGKHDLRPWYPDHDLAAAIGEVWLTAPESTIEDGPLAGKTLAEAAREYADELLGPANDGEFPLLIKMLFPADKLSVQVHPDDTEARAMGLPRGKTECWYCLESEPGATVALGLKPGVGPERMRAAVADGTAEDLLVKMEMVPGEMIFVDAGTVHAIGPGMVLLETQQTSDTTYRLFDYGRPRDLHLEKGLAVTKTQTKAGKVAPIAKNGFNRLIEERYFSVDRFEATGPVTLSDASGLASCFVVLEGRARVSTEAGATELSAGMAAVITARHAAVTVTPLDGAMRFVRCIAPAAQ
jgi:mannose-6-phosphate isomerase